MAGMVYPPSPINGQQTTDGRYYFDSSVGSAGGWRSTPLPVGGLPAGSIMAWGTNTPPANWLIADGAAVSRSVYSSLFAVIGTTYGTGDGSTTFNLPNLSGRVPVGKNGGTFGTLAGTGGAESHRHDFKFSLLDSGNYGVSGPNSGMGSGTGSAGAFRYSNGTWVGGSPNGSITAPGENASAVTTRTLGRYESIGDTELGSSVQPYLVVNYIIKASAGWTAGDSELATRVGTLEQNPNITGTLTVAGNTTLNGRVVAPNQPAFLAAGPVSTTYSLAAGGTLPFPVALTNRGNGYNTSTGRFTAPVTGVYKIGFNLYKFAGATGWLVFRINGNEYTPTDVMGTMTASAWEGATTFSVILPLTAGDYINVSQRIGQATTSIYGGHSSFYGYLIG